MDITTQKRSSCKTILYINITNFDFLQTVNNKYNLNILWFYTDCNVYLQFNMFYILF